MTRSIPLRRIARRLVPPCALTLIATACLPIPHKHTTRAGAVFAVRDARGQPIADATVHLYAGSVIGGTMRRVASTQTDTAGGVTIARVRRWHPFLFLGPDAEAPSVFGWCVQAMRYAPLGGTLQDRPGQTVAAPLVAGRESLACPEWIDRRALDEGRIVARPPARR